MLDKARHSIKDYWLHLSLFSRNGRLFLWGSFLVGLSFSIFSLLLNLYFKELGYSESFIGQVLSFTALGAVVTTLPAALIISKFENRKILLLATLFGGIFYFLQANLVHRIGLLIISLVLGMANTFFRVIAAPFFMRNSSPKERTYLFSMNFGVMLVAGIIGSWGGGYLPGLFSHLAGTRISGFRLSLVFGSILGLIGIVPFVMISEKKEPSQSQDALANNSSNSFPNLKKLKQRKELLFKLCLPFFLLGLGAGLVIPFLNLYFRDRFSAPAKTIGVFFALMQIFMFVGILLGPLLSKKLGMIRSIVWTQILSVPFMVILAFTYVLPVAVLSFLLRASLMNMSQPISSNFSMEKVEKEEQPLVNSLTMLSWALAWSISSNLGGRLIEEFSFTLPLLITPVLYILSSLFYYRFFSKAEDLKIGRR